MGGWATVLCRVQGVCIPYVCVGDNTIGWWYVHVFMCVCAYVCARDKRRGGYVHISACAMFVHDIRRMCVMCVYVCVATRGVWMGV
jgi:hypothetical protein